MNIFFALACVAGIFTISLSFIQISIFDFYFYLLPFGLALMSLFVAVGLTRSSFFQSIRPGVLRGLPLCGAFAMLACVALSVYGASLGVSLFFLLFVIVQLITYLSFWSAIVQGGRFISSSVGFIAGLTLGLLLIAYLNLDPLAILLMAFVSIAVLYAAQFLSKAMENVVYILVICLVAFGVFQARQYAFMPGSAGWLLDYGKAGPTNIGDPKKSVWGPVGLTEMYALTSDGRDAWMYTNGASPGLVLLDGLAAYDEAWWAQKAPLAMAIYDAVQPKSVVDIGSVPSDMAWRATSRGTRNIYGLYGSRDWTLVRAPGLESIKKSIVLLKQPVFSALQNVKFPVDMIVLSSAHEGEQGWTSSSAGEQRFFDRGNLLRYWQSLGEDGVLVLLSRQQSVFFRQIFSVWSALKNTGMSDAEFMEHAWGVVPDTVSTDSPYRYALVLTRKPRDEKFALAIRGQVLKLPVKYLFGYNIPPSRPYDYFYQNGINKVRTIFAQGISGMFGKQMNLDVPDSHRSIPYQFVEDVYPQYKNCLVLSVGALVGIILLPLQNLRRPEYVQAEKGPGVAIWMVSGGMTGVLLVITLAFLVAYPSTVPQELRVFCLAILMLIATFSYRFKWLVAITYRPALLLGLGSALVLGLYLLSRFAQIIEGGGKSYMVIAGILFVLLGSALSAMQSALERESERESGTELVAWWWFAMAAGSAAALFWSMRLYSAMGDSLLLIACVLLIGVASVFRWYGCLLPIETRERVLMCGEQTLGPQSVSGLPHTYE